MGVNARDFLEVTQPALAEGSATELARAVQARWSAEEVCPLLDHPEANVRRVAAVTLGLIGGQSVIDCLAAALHDTDRQVNEMAEHGLWSIWFRLCGPAACEPFRRGLANVEAERYAAAIAPLEHAQQQAPDFAEAYSQCAIARFFVGQIDEAIDDYQSTLRLMPCHFGAMAGLGHCYTHLDRLDEALACYRKTLEIHPRMAGVREAMERIISRRRTKVSLGEAPLLPRSRW